MATLGGDLLALLGQRQLVYLHHVVEHAGEDGHHLAKRGPVEGGLLGEGIAHEGGQVDRAQQTGPMGRQRLFTAGVGGTDLFAEPVVVHLVHLVDQDETGLRIVVGRGHDDVPQLARGQGLVDLAGHLAQLALITTPSLLGQSAQTTLAGSSSAMPSCSTSLAV